MAAMNEVMEVGWIECRENTICIDCDFEDAIVDEQSWQECI